MSNIKTKQPFQLPAQQRNQVGQNWEQRKTYLARGGGEVAPARQAPPKHVDQFLQGGKKPETVAHFDPKAAYRKARMHFMGAPYKVAALYHTENGSAPLKTATVGRQWTDPELLRLLNLVIENPVYANRRSIQKARQAAAGTSPARKPAGPASPPAATQQQQQYAMALRRSKVPSK